MISGITTKVEEIPEWCFSEDCEPRHGILRRCVCLGFH